MLATRGRMESGVGEGAPDAHATEQKGAGRQMPQQDAEQHANALIDQLIPLLRKLSPEVRAHLANKLSVGLAEQTPHSLVARPGDWRRLETVARDLESADNWRQAIGYLSESHE